MSDREEMQAARSAGLVKRHETRQSERILRSQWVAQPEDTIGGWCVTLAIPATPAQGNPPIADFCTQDVAEHIARLHNTYLAGGIPSMVTAVEPESEALTSLEAWYADQEASHD